MLKIIASTIIKRSQPFFLFHRKARTNDIPTQAATLLPFNINYLHDNPGSRRYSKIVGRGPSSGKGKTCGRGVKGHKSRSGGGVPPKFEGGQSILARRLPKFGARRQNFDRYDYINIGSIIYYIKRGILNPAQTITIKSLVDVGLVKKVKFGVKLLSKGIDQLNVPLHFELSDASRLIIQKVKALGGSIKCVYRTPLLLKAHLKPQRFPLPLEDPIPIVRHVQKLSKLEQRGAQVVYKKPEWKIKQESQIKVQKKQYPADRSPGVGANKIRKRKQKIYKVINYNLP